MWRGNGIHLYDHMKIPEFYEGCEEDMIDNDKNQGGSKLYRRV